MTGFGSIEEYEVEVIPKDHKKPILYLKNMNWCKTDTGISKGNGDMESKPIVIGGGTYAQAIKNAVAFGPISGQMGLEHQKMNIFLLIFAQMYKDICRQCIH